MALTDGASSCWAPAAGVNSMAISQDGRLLATGNLDGRIKLWDLTRLIWLADLNAHTERINDLAFSPNSNILASASDDGLGYLWSMPDGSIP